MSGSNLSASRNQLQAAQTHKQMHTNIQIEVDNPVDDTSDNNLDQMLFSAKNGNSRQPDFVMNFETPEHKTPKIEDLKT